jgi:hypothetical protein
MGYLETYRNKLRSETSPGQLSENIFQLLILNAGNIATDVRRRWLIGESINGGIIGHYSRPEYAMYKASLNPLAKGNVDLTLTGALGESINIKRLSANKYEIFSTDEKYQKIGRKYGFEEFGLTDEQQGIMFEELYQFALQTAMNQVWRA